jgi:methyl-accepting chemotaxis protein
VSGTADHGSREGGAALALALGAAVAVAAFSQASAAAERSGTTATLSRQAAHLTYLAADWNGWQTAYALDALVGPELVAQNGEAIAELARMATELQSQVLRFRV